MKRSINTSNLYRKFILQFSLLAIIILSLSISCILYSMLQAASEHQTASDHAFMETVAEKIDSHFLLMNTFALRVSSDTTLSSTLHTSPRSLQTAKENYLKYTYPLQLLETSLLFYNDETVCILAPDGIYRPEYFDACFSKYGLTLDMLNESSQGLKKQTWFYLPETQNMIYAYPLHYIGGKSTRTIFFVLNAHTIFDSLCDGFSKEGTVLVISSPEFTLQINSSGPIEILDAPNDIDYQLQRSLRNASLQLLVSTPQQAEPFPLNLLLTIGGALAIISSVLVFLLSRSAYRPIQSLVTQVTHPKDRTGKVDLLRKYDDLSTIQDSFDQVLSDRLALINQLEKQARLVYSSVLLKILHGNAEDAETLRKIMKIEPQHTLYRLVYVMLDRVERVRKDADYAALSCLQDAVLRVLHRLAGEKHFSVAMTSFLQGKCAVILIASEPDFPAELIQEQLQELQLVINTSLSQTVTLVLGSPFDRISQAKNAYRLLCECAQWRIFTGWNSLILQDQPPELPAVPSDKEIRAADLIALCRIPDEAEAMTALRTYFLQQCGAPDEILFRAVYYRVFDQLQNAVDSDDMTEYLREPETLEQVLECLSALVHALCEQSRRRESSGRMKLLDQARHLLDEGYADPQLCTASLATTLGVSEGYLRQEFKRQYGLSVSAYLDDIRLCRVKHLLVNTDLSVKEIVEQVGFADSSNFIRKFKRMEGETPIAYRNRIKENGK